MKLSASRVFDFINQHQTSVVERHEISLSRFSLLRRHLRVAVVGLSQCDDYEPRETSNRLRALLSEWLTVPVQFDAEMIDSLSIVLSGSEASTARWGIDISSALTEARNVVHALIKTDNPVRMVLQRVIREMNEQRQNFKIYCHRRARRHFESLVDAGSDPLNDEKFLHSAADYRRVDPFDVLIKVGPLRSRGWGAIPDAVITAPRFTTLIQAVWSGCDDEADFGYDPVLESRNSEANAKYGSQEKRNSFSWTKRIVQVDDGVSATPDLDDLQVFEQIVRAADGHRLATLVQIDDAHGILYPSNSQILSFDLAPNACKPIDRRRPLVDALSKGMLLVRPLLVDTDFGGLRAAYGHYSQIWKARMREECEKDSTALIQRLRLAGLNLLHIEAAVAHWCQVPTTVIHAPQQKKHFEILIRVLGIDPGTSDHLEAHSTPLWMYAWDEIRRSRGEAIQAGFQSHDIVEEQLTNALNAILPEIRLKAAKADGFSIPIPSLGGIVVFNTIRDIEHGFLVPEVDLKFVRDLHTVDQWRV